MIVQKELSNGLVETYSDAGFYIHGGNPEADYERAIDPATAKRVYTETDRKIPVPEDEDTGADDEATAKYEE